MHPSGAHRLNVLRSMCRDRALNQPVNWAVYPLMREFSGHMKEFINMLLLEYKRFVASA